MPSPREIVEKSRPICNCEHPERCRKTAVASFDGIWLCEECQTHSPVTKIVKVGIPIRWERPGPICAIPGCMRASCAVFHLDKKQAPHCKMHGYVVMSQLGAHVDEIFDLPETWNMIHALKKDGFEVVTEGIPQLH